MDDDVQWVPAVDECSPRLSEIYNFEITLPDGTVVRGGSDECDGEAALGET